MKLFLLVSAIALFTVSSCKKEGGEKMDSKNSFEVKKNDQPWEGTRLEGNLGRDNRLAIFLHGQGEEYLVIHFNLPEQVGTIADFSAGYINLIGGDVIIDNHPMDKDKPHQLQITSVNAEAREVSGKFSFTLKRDDWFTKSAGAQSNVYKGEFHIKYKTPVN